MKRFIALLKERGTVSDPTLGAFEGMFMTEAGEIDPNLAPIADRLPPQVQRSLYGGGLTRRPIRSSATASRTAGWWRW